MNLMYEGEEERQAAIPSHNNISPTPDPVPEEAKEDENDNPPPMTAVDAEKEEVQKPAEPSKPDLVGSLTIEIVEAKLTRDTETFSKMDPYCKIWMPTGD